MATVRLRCLSDYCSHRANLHVGCLCDHNSIVDAAKMLRWFQCHGWNDAMENVRGKLYCSKCRRRPWSIRGTQECATGPIWGPRTERDWEYLVKRLRNR